MISPRLPAAGPDVLVVGGGPAGSATALLLVRLGHDVHLVDRARFPRAKPCGECVDPGAVAALGRIGLLDDVLALDPVPLDGWRLRAGGADVSARFGRDLRGLGVERTRLDTALVERARREGTHVHEGVRVTHVTAASGSERRPTVMARTSEGEVLTLRPRIVVGADGLRSVVVRSLGLIARRPRLRKVSLTGHVEGEGLGQVDGEGFPVHGGLLDVSDGVTLGVAPVGRGRWNVTVVATRPAAVVELAADPAGFLAGTVRSRYPNGHWTVTGVPQASGPFDWPVRRTWAPGVVLVGDAAGYFDPFTGQGIYRALRGAELAAEAVHAALAERSWSPLERYDRRWTREVSWSRRVQRGVEAVMSRPALRGRVLRRLGTAGGLPTVIRVTGDAASPFALLNPRVWLG